MTSESKSSTVCPRCQTRYLLPVNLVGRRTVCRVCGLNFHLLPPPQAASTRPATWPFPDSSPPREGPPSQAPDFFSRLELRPGQLILATYEVLSFLGQGGMSQVFRVRHRDWGLDLALKVPRLEFIKKGLGREFSQEAALWAALGLHPNIAACYYVRSIFGVPAIFAQYAEGGSLNHWIRNAEGGWGRLYRGTVEEVTERILDIAIQSAWGLAYAHAENLLHLDVKPHNFLMAENGRVLVTDFGVSRALSKSAPNKAAEKVSSSLPGPEEKPGSSATATARTAFKLPPSSGTPEYYSPERAAQQEPGPGDDLWAWALSLLEMFWGGRYWEMGSVAGETLKERRRGGEISFKAPLPLPGPVADFLENCLAPEPERRQQSLNEASQGLIEVYERVLNRPFPRARPRGGRNTADSLNNQAVSFLDLGLSREAEELFQRALAADPGHLEAVFNQGLFAWRQGTLADEELLNRLEMLSSGRPGREVELGLLTAQIHLERGDPVAAEEALRGPAAGELARETVNLRNLVSQLRFSGRRSLKALGPFTSAMVGLAASPDGRRLLAAFEDETVRIYQSGKFEVIGEFSSGLKFAAAALLKRGQAIVAGYRENGPGQVELRFFNLENGQPQLEYITAFETLTGLAPLPGLGLKGGLALAGTGPNSFIQLLDVASGHIVQNLAGPEEPARGLATSLSSRFIGACDRNSLYLWDLETKAPPLVLTDSGAAWSGLAVNDAGQILAGRGREIWFYETLTDEPRKLSGHGAPITFLTFLEGQKMAFTAGQDGRLRLWDLNKGRCLFTFKDHGVSVEMAQILNNGGAAVSYGPDGYLRHWNLAGPVRRPQASFRLARAALEAAPPELRPKPALEGNFTLSSVRAELSGIAAEPSPGPADLKAALGLANQDSEALGWPLPPDLLALKKRLYSCYPRLALIGRAALPAFKDDFSQPRPGILNGKWSARGLGQNLSLRLLETGETEKPLSKALVFALPEEITSLAFSPGGRRLAVGGHEGGLWLFRPSRPEPLAGQIRWTRPVVKSAFLSPGEADFSYLITLDQQGLLASWALTGEDKPPKAPESSLQLAEGYHNRHLSASPGRNMLLAAGTGKKPEAALIGWPLSPQDVRRWELSSSPSALEFSPVGKLAALGLADGRILLSRPEEPDRTIMELGPEGEKPVATIAFSPDGGFLASAYANGRPLIWNLENGQAIPLDDHGRDSAFTSLSFSPEAAFLHGLTETGSLMSWALTWRLGENPGKSAWGQPAGALRGGLNKFPAPAADGPFEVKAGKNFNKPGFWARLFAKLAFWRR